MTFTKWLCEASCALLGLLVALVTLSGILYSSVAASALPTLQNWPAAVAVALGAVAGTLGVPRMAVWVKKEASATLGSLFAHLAR